MRPVREFTDVASVSEVPVGELFGVILPDGATVCLYNRNGEIGALGGVCTHAEFAMSSGVLHADGTIECVWHGAQFDCRTGAVRRQPATVALPVFDVRVEGGRVFVATAPSGAGAPP